MRGLRTLISVGILIVVVGVCLLVLCNRSPNVVVSSSRRVRSGHVYITNADGSGLRALDSIDDGLNYYDSFNYGDIASDGSKVF